MHSTIHAVCGQQKGQNRAKSHVWLIFKKNKKQFFFFLLKRAGRHFGFFKRAGRHEKGAGRHALQKKPRQNTEQHGLINPLFATISSTALVTHYTCDAVTLLRLHRAIPSISSSTYICLMFWLTQFVQEHASTHNSPASRQEHFPTSTHSLHLVLPYVLANIPMESNGQYRWVRSRTSTGQMDECAW